MKRVKQLFNENSGATSTGVKTCNLCSNGMRHFQNESGKWLVGRCDCWLGKKLAEAEHDGSGGPNVWKRVVTLQPDVGPHPETIGPDNVKGLEFIRKNCPDLYKRMPKHLIDRINAYAKGDKEEVPF